MDYRTLRQMTCCRSRPSAGRPLTSLLLSVFLLLFLVSTAAAALDSSCDSVLTLQAKDLQLKSFHEDGRKVYYRDLQVDRRTNRLLVGAMNFLYALDLDDISKRDVLNIRINTTQKGKERCFYQGFASEPTCQNHIRVIGRNTTFPDNLIVCGSGSFFPRLYHMQFTGAGFRMVSEQSGQGICPNDADSNGTSILVEQGNPYGQPALYSATYSDMALIDPLIVRPQYYFPNRTLAMEYTRTLDSWLSNKAAAQSNFVGSFEVGPKVYFFFREIAQEHENCGQQIFSRVASVCKSDKGHGPVMRRNWSSFLKARIVCSIPGSNSYRGEYPYYFDEIQDVKMVDSEHFYALFTTNTNGLTASAICLYSIHDIEKAFQGPFRAQAHNDIRSYWLPVPDSELLQPRPGNCSVDSHSLSVDWATSYRNRRIMDHPVQPTFGRPVMVKEHSILNQLVLVNNASGAGDVIFYASTNTGQVFKMAVWPMSQNTLKPQSYVLTSFKPFAQPRQIWSMIRHGKFLYLGTDTSVTEVDTETCSLYTKIDHCIHDPHCGWHDVKNRCQQRGAVRLLTYADIDHSRLLEDELITRGISLYLPERISRSKGNSVTLRLNYKLTVAGPVTWTRNKSEVEGDRHFLARDSSLLIQDLLESDSGTYLARDSQGRVLGEYQLEVAATKKDIEERWIRKFDQWCDEFDRYKNSIREWERKCSDACCCDEPYNAIPQFNGK